MIKIGNIFLFYSTVEEHDVLLEVLREQFDENKINDDAFNDSLCGDEKYIQVLDYASPTRLKHIINRVNNKLKRFQS